MKNAIYSIYDTATCAYMRPFTAQTDGQAKRLFEDIALDSSSEIGKHPECYTLFALGTFNDHTGELTPSAQGPVKVVSALEITSQRKQADSMSFVDNNGEVTHDA